MGADMRDPHVSLRRNYRVRFLTLADALGPRVTSHVPSRRPPTQSRAPWLTKGGPLVIVPTFRISALGSATSATTSRERFAGGLGFRGTTSCLRALKPRPHHLKHLTIFRRLELKRTCPPSPVGARAGKTELRRRRSWGDSTGVSSGDRTRAVEVLAVAET
jgi:hypothetical protein